MENSILFTNQQKMLQYIKNVKASKLSLERKRQLIYNKIQGYIKIQDFVKNNSEESKATSLGNTQSINTNNKLSTNTLTQGTIKTVKNKYALLVGINYKGTTRKLDGCINDANNIKQLLTNSLGFTNANITYITDDTSVKPTKQNIINNLTNMIKKANTGDTIFFFYSGHGTYSLSKDNSELTGRDQLLVPLDATTIQSCISDNELNALLRANIKDGVNMFGMIDACYSGTVFDLKYNYMPDNSAQANANTFSITSNPYVNPIGKGQIFILSGCNDLQTSADALIKQNNVSTYNGALTYSFLNTISQKGTNISFKNMMTNMRTILTNGKFRQTPQISSDTFLDVSAVTLQGYIG